MFSINQANDIQYDKNIFKIRIHFVQIYEFEIEHNFELLNKFISLHFHNIGLLEEYLDISE